MTKQKQMLQSKPRIFMEKQSHSLFSCYIHYYNNIDINNINNDIEDMHICLSTNQSRMINIAKYPFQ